MRRLIADLLDFTRTRLGGAIPLMRVPADLSDICQQVVFEIQAAHNSAVTRATATSFANPTTAGSGTVLVWASISRGRLWPLMGAKVDSPPQHAQQRAAHLSSQPTW
jgi:hypothetical protein